MLNNVTWVAPDTPSLMTMLSMGNDSLNSKVYGPQTAQHILNRGEVMDLMVINFDANAHPFHLHGFNFQVTRGAFVHPRGREFLAGEPGRPPRSDLAPNDTQWRPTSPRATLCSTRRTRWELPTR